MALYSLANQAGASFRAALNTVLGKLHGNYHGSTDPSGAGDSAPGMGWVDTNGANPVLKIRNSADTAWIMVGTFNGTTFELAGTTSFGRSLIDDASASAARSTLGLGSLATQSGALGMDFIESQDASASSSLDFTGFDATEYDGYRFVLQGIVPASNSAFALRFSTNGGSTYLSTNSYNYFHTGDEDRGGTEIILSRLVPPTPTIELVGSAGAGVSGVLDIAGPHLAKKTIATWSLGYETDGSAISLATAAGWNDTTTAVDAVRFFMAVGNIASGTISMYGYRNA